jgi:hypothetical protein
VENTQHLRKGSHANGKVMRREFFAKSICTVCRLLQKTTIELSSTRGNEGELNVVLEASDVEVEGKG